MAGIEHDRLTSAVAGGEDKAFDRAIRPKTLDEYVGQSGVKQQMGIFIEAARRRHEALEAQPGEAEEQHQRHPGAENARRTSGRGRLL